mgnify:CR=1 FL=1
MTDMRIIPDVIRAQTLITLPPDTTARAAAEAMVAHNISAVLVVDAAGGLIGIATERDMTRHFVAADRDPGVTTLGDIMTPDPDTLEPGDSATAALQLMELRNYRHLPVVDGGRLVGIVSIRDLYRTVKATLERDMNFADELIFGDRYRAAGDP